MTASGIPAEAGIQFHAPTWTPAFAGVRSVCRKGIRA
ncbi:hypothetical protein FHS99_000884 [Sphingomonas prati]|uniref:Uncharacterized protein n=1 Tax=Sphingomonas prati TaxID=1843237 RepID=A0A7W9BQT8_9SPHN|nr:hypothetical protein [Sphingomonas prati]